MSKPKRRSRRASGKRQGALEQLAQITGQWAQLTLGEALEKARRRGLAQLPPGDPRQGSLVLGSLLGEAAAQEALREGRRSLLGPRGSRGPRR